MLVSDGMAFGASEDSVCKSALNLTHQTKDLNGALNSAGSIRCKQFLTIWLKPLPGARQWRQRISRCRFHYQTRHKLKKKKRNYKKRKCLRTIDSSCVWWPQRTSYATSPSFGLNPSSSRRRSSFFSIYLRTSLIHSDVLEWNTPISVLCYSGRLNFLLFRSV